MNDPRKEAVLSLIRREERGSYSNLEIEAVLRKADFSPRDEALYTTLVLGTISKKITIDYLLSRFSDTPFPELETPCRAILEIGAFQILYLDRVPARAAIFEAVEEAKELSPRAASLINAVLRRVLKEKENLPALLSFPGKKGISLQYSYPKWLVSLWIAAYGKEKCLSIAAEQNRLPSLTLRANTCRISVEELRHLLEKNGFFCHENAVSPTSLTLEKSTDPRLLPGFAEGLFFVQDGAAARAVDLLAPEKGQFVLDVCAAPGGKSFGAAIAMENTGTVLSAELYPKRLELIRAGAGRLGLTNLSFLQADSTLPLPEVFGKADRVICDVPCSGYGVIARKPDIRLKSEEESRGLPELQERILEQSAKALKPGGILVYSTCTLNPQENNEVVARFLASHPDYVSLGDETVFPQGGENDGFYCHRIARRSNGEN